LIRGRTFSAAEAASGAALVVVDEDFVQRYCRDRDPLGLTFKIGVQNQDAMREVTIVGVARTVKQRSLDEHAARPTIYLPQDAPADPILLVRTRVDPAAVAEPLREAIREVAPRAKLMGMFSMREWIEKTVRERVRLNTLLELLGAMALALAGVGLYAVLAFAVRLRTAEFGIRMALGASGPQVQGSVLRQGAWLAGAGLLLAVPFAYLLAHALDARLYQVSTLDPISYLGVALMLGTVSVSACWFPAWRAARVNPIEALRCE
jgi:putative ABC transport system permease protein